MSPRDYNLFTSKQWTEEKMKGENNYTKIINNLMLLDSESLLLISSGIELLLARQNMKMKTEIKTSDQVMDQIVDQVVV